MNEKSNVKKVIGVVSGKGGVGKSSVTAMLAASTQRLGYKVAVLDADITGPSIPQAFGLADKAKGTDTEIFPVTTRTGIKTISVNSLLDDETDPVVWRGPVLSGVIQQFYSDVVWGDIDVMYVDMPPGTGDVALTVFQSLPLEGIVIVTSPQQLVSMIVEKAVKMAQMMNVPVIGIVENMSFFTCPDCGCSHKIFGDGHASEVAAKYKIGTISQIPIDPKIAKACDDGKAEDIEEGWLDNMVSSCLAADNPNKHGAVPAPSESCTHDCQTCGIDGCESRTQRH